jgi:AcrR family transcriptional regulator
VASVSAPGPAKERRREVLSRADIIDVAAELSASEGPSGVTFRALGAKLGVAATAIYRHFRDKDELMLALADQIFAEIAERFEPGDDWAADLRQLCALCLEVCRRHAFTAAWLGYRNTGGPGDHAVMVVGLRIMLAAGLTQEQALFHHELLTDALMGLLTIEAMRGTLDEPSRRQDRDFLAALYTNIAREDRRFARLPTIALASDPDRLFAAQMELHIHAIRRTVAGDPVLPTPY